MAITPEGKLTRPRYSFKTKMQLLYKCKSCNNRCMKKLKKKWFSNPAIYCSYCGLALECVSVYKEDL